MIVWWYMSITSIPMLKLYIRLGIQRCDDPERLEILTVSLQVCQILHYTSPNINAKFKVQHFQLVIH